MHLALSRSARPWAFTALAAAILALTACGGDSSSTPTTPTTLSGVVIDGPLQGATVCLDLNKNGSCDSGEPTSSATDANGAYTITGLTADQVNSGAPLIAVIPGTAVDTSTGTAVGEPYTLSAPAGKPSVISPITHMVQSGIAQGLTQAQSEAAVAAQLQVSSTNLYNNYVASTSGDNATLATAVPTIVSSLQAGAPVVVAPPAASSAGYWVRAFNFTSANTYTLRYYYSSNQPDSSTGLFTYYDVREGLSGGTPIASSSLYDSMLVATASGWKAFNGATPNTSSGGSPNTSTHQYGYTYASYRTDFDVSGMTLKEVIEAIQDTEENSVITVNGVDASTLSGTMPAGAKVRKVSSTETGTPVAYRVSDGNVTHSGAAVTTLAELVNSFPVPSATPTTANTASMGGISGGNSSTCTPATGTTVCAKERVRVAFGSGNAVTYYLCDFDKSTSNTSNCAAAGTGTYATGTAVDGSTPIMTFAGLPSETTAQTFTRVFVQRNGVIYFGWKDKPGRVTTQMRLNKVAFETLAAALGVTPPSISDTASVYAGTWSASYSGGDTGTCSSVQIDALGHVNGSCTSTTIGGSFSVFGTVTSSGVASFTASGGTSSGAVFNGSFTTSSGSGSWSQSSSGLSGSWTASKP